MPRTDPALDPSTGIAVPDLLERSARLHPERTAISSPAATVSYAELLQQVRAVTGGLRRLGVGKGDHVGLLLRNSVEFVVAYMGASAAGAVVVPLNVRLAAPELAYQVHDVGCDALVYAGDMADLVRDADLDVATVVTTGRPATGEVSWEALVGGEPDDGPPVDIRSTDPCVVLYTAGTTGFPKGAVRTHGAQLWPTIENVLMCEMTADTVVYGMLPFFHHGGWFIAPLSAMLVGATLVVGGDGPLDGEAMLDTIERERVSVVLLVPTMVEALVAAADGAARDLGSLRFVVSAAAALRPDTLDRLVALLPEHTRLIPNAYAQTEATWLSSVPPWRLDKAHTIGLPAGFVRLRLLGQDGAEVPHGEIGEIGLQGPAVFDGYHGAPEQTAATVTDGWVRTGDLASLDDEGYLVFAGRARDMLKSGGENVYAAEVERVLLQHPDVADAACIALPDDRWVEMVAAVVVPRDGCEVAPDDVIAFCREHLAGYKCPKRVFLAPSLPKSFKGEVLKHLLVQEHTGEGG